VSASKRLTLPVIGLVLALVGLSSLLASTGRAQPPPAPTAEQAYRAAVTAQVATAASHMTTAGYHDLDETIEAGQIPPGALGRVRRARIVAAATQWPEPLQTQAQELVEHSLHVEEALATEDPAVAGPAAHELHEVGDAFIAAVYNWLATVARGQSQP